MIRVLFVCAGNTCRSPLAEGVMRGLIARAGLGEHLLVDSAGSAPQAEGLPPRPQTLAILAREGWPWQELSTRELQTEDFKRFDYLIALDEANLRYMQALARPERWPKLHLLAEYGGAAWSAGPSLPDPIYTGDYEETYRLVLLGCRGLLEFLRQLIAPA